MTTRVVRTLRVAAAATAAGALLVLLGSRGVVTVTHGAGKLLVPPGVLFEAPSVEPRIAVSSAIDAGGGGKPDAWAYVLMTNPNVGPGLVPGIGPDGMVRYPVYVLQFENTEVPLFGPSVETGVGMVVGTTQVYVDANTGAPIYSRSIGSKAP